MTKQTNKQRRKFIGQLGLIAGGSTLLATQNKLQLIKSALATDYNAIQDFKSLVCIFLAGGNDSFNMFVPYEISEYQNYQNIRQALAIPRDQLLPVNGVNYALHPSMSAVKNLFNQNNIGLISNVGNLLQPLTRDQLGEFRAGNKNIKVPQKLYSHSHQQETWQTNRPRQTVSVPSGWGGLIADMLEETNGNPIFSPTISLSGTNFWQSGNFSQPFSMDSGGVTEFNYLSGDSWPLREISRTLVWNAILGLDRNHVLEQQATASFISTKNQIKERQQALLDAPEIQTLYPNRNSLADNLKMVARLISIREDIGLKRQIFFVRLGGWDNHNNQMAKHAKLLTTLSEALDAFYQTTVEFGIADTVTTFTASEFGRSSTSNGDGTDHGWGGHQLVMGGAVSGGSIYGSLPDITPGSIDDEGYGGRIIPTLAVDQYGATLAKWMGIADSDLNSIFPNLNQFNVRDLGFMN